MNNQKNNVLTNMDGQSRNIIAQQPSYITSIEVAVKKTREDAIIPSYAHGTEDSGMDAYAVVIANKENGEWVEHDSYAIKPNETVLVKTGLAFAIPQGLEIQVRPTSGNSLKTMLRVANAPGTIDAGYRNEAGVILTNIGTEDITVSKGDKIAQLVLCPVFHAALKVVDDLSDSNRGLNGYGSTGTIKDVK